MPVTTAESYLELLEKSRLLDEKQLTEARTLAPRCEDAPSLAVALIQRGFLTRWQAAQLLAGRSSFFLGKYKLIELLGSGGMGRVFVAEHTTMNRPVALKIISKQLGQDPASLERFFTEARAIAALNHPNIVHAYDVDKENDRYYMVMEFVEGQDLQRMVEAKGPLEPERAADYVRQAADGLAHAHGRNMIHCDVKPANLLINQLGVVKILDMGMARLIGRAKDSGAGQDERLLGTIDYMAPEQALNSPEMDHRVDLYSLGCTFYFLLTGRPPFPEGTLPERILKHQTAEPCEIAQLRQDVPEDLASICKKMMAKQPGDRFQSADEVSRALAEWASPGREAEGVFPAMAGDSLTGAVDVRAQGDAPKAKVRAGAALAARWQRLAALVEGRRKFWFAGGGLAALAVLVGVILLLAGPGGESNQRAGVQGTSPGRATSERKSATQGEPSRPDEAEEHDDWPDLPDFGNLRNFDPEALPDDVAKVPGQSAKKTKPGESPPKKPPAKEPKPGQTEPQKTEPGKPKPDSQESEKPKEPPDAETTPAPKTSAPKTSAPKTPPPKTPAEKTPAQEPPAQKTQPDQPESGKPEPKEEAPKEKPPPLKEGGDEETVKPQEPPPKEPKPEPKEPQDVDPLGELAEIVDLPEFDAKPASDEAPAGPFALGKIHSEPDVDWQLYLLGGDTALRRSRQFVLRQQQQDPAKASWLVELETATTGGDPAREDVARIWRDQDALMFQWAEDATTSANYLRNCMLQVRVEGKSKYVKLTSPKPAEPIPVDLERGIQSATIPVKWLPDAGSLRVHITKVEGREGYLVDPEGAAQPKKPFEISFPRTDRHGNTTDKAALRLTFTPRPAAMLAKLQLIEPPPTAFRELKGQAAIVRNQLENLRDQLQKQLNPQDKDKAPRGNQRSLLSAQIDEIEKRMWYVDFYIEVHGNAKVHFRILAEVEEHQVIFASTEPADTLPGAAAPSE
jgi:hypothetical protein